MIYRISALFLILAGSVFADAIRPMDSDGNLNLTGTNINMAGDHIFGYDATAGELVTSVKVVQVNGGFEGEGTLLTNVNAELLNGLAATNFALLASNATFASGTTLTVYKIEGDGSGLTNFVLTGDGSGVTNVDAETLDGIDSATFLTNEVDGNITNEAIVSFTINGSTAIVTEASETYSVDLTPAITAAVVAAGLSPGSAVIGHVTITNDLTISSVAASFVIVEGFVQHHGKNFTITPSNMSPNVGGIFQVIHNFSGFAGGNNQDWHSHLFVSGVEEGAFGWDMRLDASPQAASAGFTGILNLTNNQVVDIRVSKDGSASSITYTEFGLQIIRIDLP